MKLRLRDYVAAAFSARPWGMLVPPNWIGLAAFGLLGLLNPGFWMLGAGLELGYLYSLCMNSRFRFLVDSMQMGQSRREWQAKLQGQITQLEPQDQMRYRTLEGRCAAILEQQQKMDAASAGVAAQSQSLGRLLWIYLRLLLMRQSIQRVLAEAGGRERSQRPLDERITQLKAQLEQETIGEDLRKSLASQLEILRQRLQSQEQARQKLAFLDAELTRIQEQVELIREQAVLATDPQAVSQRIDQVAETLGGTTQWIREQQQIYGQVEDLMAEPPPVAIQNTPQAQKQG